MAFYDARCQKCNTRIGWSGNYSDRPSCPRCQHKLNNQELQDAEKEIHEAEEKVLQAMREKKSKSKTK